MERDLKVYTFYDAPLLTVVGDYGSRYAFWATAAHVII